MFLNYNLLLEIQFTGNETANFFINFFMWAIPILIILLIIKTIIFKAHNWYVSKRADTIERGIKNIKIGMTQKEVMACFNNISPNSKSRKKMVYKYKYWFLHAYGDKKEGNTYSLFFGKNGLLEDYTGFHHTITYTTK